MNYFWLDANAIVKQYVTEEGTPLINYLFDRVPLNRILCLFDSIGEVFSVIVRKRNNRSITEAEFNQAKQRFKAEFIDQAEVTQVDAAKNQKDAALQLIETHSMNNTDAHILQCALDKANELRTAGDDLILVSSDKRLLKAAKTERLFTFNPETDNQIDLEVLINSP